MESVKLRLQLFAKTEMNEVEITRNIKKVIEEHVMATNMVNSQDIYITSLGVFLMLS